MLITLEDLNKIIEETPIPEFYEHEQPRSEQPEEPWFGFEEENPAGNDVLS